MKRILFIALIALAACNQFSFRQAEYDHLKTAFAEPPQSAKPMVWWHWMNGNITPEGLRKDILWMNRVGIGGFHVFDAGLDSPQIVEKRLGYMSPEWKDAFAGAIALADSLGLEVAVASSPGWSSTGGPWVTPEDAMKKLTWRFLRVEGGKRFEGPLPDPLTVSSRFQNVPLPLEYNHHQDGPIPEWYYEDIAVYAVKLPASYRSLSDLGAKVSSSGGRFCVETLTDGDLDNAGLLPARPCGDAWIQYEFPELRSFKAVTVVNAIAQGGGHATPPVCRDSLQISDDGIHFRTLCGITVGAAQQQTEMIPHAEARFWRLKHKNPAEMRHYGMLVKAADPASEIGDFILHTNAPVNHYEEKAGFGYPRDLTLYPSAADAEPCEVLDITANYTDGVLAWDAPEGDWMIYRFGCSLTGKKNHPSSPEATGLEVDKLDKAAFSRYLHHYLDMYKDASDGLLGKRGIQYLLIDSYESGAQTWTASLPAEFKARRGYDMMPWLPATAGVVIGSAEETERFLWDFRRTIGELFAENYDNASAIVRNDYGMDGVFIESHEHGRNCPADGISIKKTASYPMAAMWIQGKGGSATRIPEGKADILESASTAHIYGQNLVAAESLTISGTDRQAYTYYPGNLKHAANLEMGSGVNRFVIHESTHQPVDGLLPGMGMGPYGQWFHRNETWAEEAGPWIQYLTRSCAMLQQGRYVADYLYYYGEDSNVTAQFSGREVDAPFGWRFDFAGPEVLLKELKVRGHKLVTSSGMEYSALYVGGEGLPMSEEIRACLDKFRRAGVKVIENEPLDKVVEGIEPELILSDSEGMQYLHRTAPSAEIYWLNNQQNGARSVKASFRISGRKPMLWDPVTGKIRPVSYSFKDGRTVIPLEFEGDEAYFVVFGEKTKVDSFELTEKELSQRVEFGGPWNVEFQKGRGAPASMEFPELCSWTDCPIEGVKYFSGTAIYRKSFEYHPEEGTDVLDLGNVGCIARVFINGKDAGLAWKAPYKLDVTGMMREGENELEIHVTNLWVNRLIGDARSGAGEKYTYTSFKFYKGDDPLIPSGLMGPVKMETYIIWPHLRNAPSGSSYTGRGRKTECR